MSVIPCSKNKDLEQRIKDYAEVLKAEAHTVAVVDAVPPEDVLSINTPEQLAEVDGILRKRIGKSHKSEGRKSRV